MFRRIVKCSHCGSKPSMSKEITAEGIRKVSIKCSCGFFGVTVEYHKERETLKAKRICIKHWNRRNKEYAKTKTS